MLDGSRRITLRNRRFIRKIPMEARNIQENRYDIPKAPTNTSPNIPPILTTNVITSTPRKASSLAPNNITLPISPVQDCVHDELSIIAQREQTHEVVPTSPATNITRDALPLLEHTRDPTLSQLATENIIATQPAKTYPKRHNVQKPERLGFPNND